MENYQIVPWIDEILSPGIVSEQYVPPELELLAREVLTHYDLQVHDMLLITSKPDKGGAIWKIGTSKGNLSIKVLHRRPRRSLFSIGAQSYMSGLGYRVPSFIPTKEGNYYVEAGGKLWIVTDWIEPLVPVSKIDLEGASVLCYGLGEFHKNSKGYVPPKGAERSSRIYGWGKYYEKIIAKIGWFQDIALAYPETAASASLLAVVEDFKRQANDIFHRFQDSPYARMIAKGEPHWGLVHQDFGWSNGQMGPGGIWVIDLDGVSYDLPIRDLRKLITSTMDDMGVWDLTWIRGMIDAYNQANPLDQETFEILWIDMAFPNEFYKHVKEIVFNPTLFLDTELGSILDRVLRTETSKWQALTELEKDKANYPIGDYTMESVVPFVSERAAFVLPGDLWMPSYTEPSEPIAIPSTPETVYAETLEPIATPYVAEIPEVQEVQEVQEIPVPLMHLFPAYKLPKIFGPGLAIIQPPAIQRQKKITLRVPKRRSSAKAKFIKKNPAKKKRKQKKLTKWQRRSRLKLIWSYKKWRNKKVIKSVRKPSKKRIKPSKRVNKPIKKIMKRSQRNHKVTHRMKKRQIKHKKRTV